MNENHRPIHHHALAIIAAPLAHLHHRRYEGKKKHLILDTMLNAVIWALAILVIYLFTLRPAVPLVKVTWPEMPVVSGQVNTWTIRAENTGTQELNNAEIKVILPQGWKWNSTDTLTVDKWSGGEVKQWDISFVPTFEPEKKYTVKAEASWKYWRQEMTMSTQKSGRVAESGFDLTMTSPASAVAGDSATISLQLANHKTQAIKDVYIRLDLPSGASVVSSQPEQKDGALIFNEITSGQKTKAAIKVKMPDKSGKSIRFTARAYYLVDDKPVYQISRTVDVLLMAKSGADIVSQTGQQVSFAAELNYYSDIGEQFGFGPLPPKVGEETGYRIFWYVRPGAQAIESGRVTATLPAGVKWIGHVSSSGGGAVTYDAKTRQVIWNVGNIGGNTGVIVGSFDVGLVPGKSDTGKAMSVSGAAIFTARINSRSVKYAGDVLKTTDVDGGSTARGLVQS